jgi:hypothetical protein
MTKSCGVTFATSSIFSTSSFGVGTHGTSLPACPSTGSNGFAGFCANETVLATSRKTADKGQFPGNGNA